MTLRFITFTNIISSSSSTTHIDDQYLVGDQGLFSRLFSTSVPIFISKYFFVLRKFQKSFSFRIFVTMVESEKTKKNTVVPKKNTRDTIIEVAQELFAHSGVKKTTINEIAEKAGKGRRTVYMYFRNKEELLQAIVEKELDALSLNLEKVFRRSISPYQKLTLLMYRHIETIYQIVMRNGSLKADFFNDISHLERIRYKFDLKEQRIIALILEEGTRLGDFTVNDIKTTAMLLQYSIKGLEVPFINQQTHRTSKRDFERLRLASEQMLFYGLHYKGNK